MKATILILLLLLLTPVRASEQRSQSILALSTQLDLSSSFEQIENELNKKPELVSEELRRALVQANYSIDRAALIQSATENTLTSRVAFLEAQLQSQYEVIAEFELLVDALKKEIERLKKDE